MNNNVRLRDHQAMVDLQANGEQVWHKKKYKELKKNQWEMP